MEKIEHGSDGSGKSQNTTIWLPHYAVAVVGNTGNPAVGIYRHIAFYVNYPHFKNLIHEIIEIFLVWQVS